MSARILRTLLLEQVLRTWPILIFGFVAGSLALLSALEVDRQWQFFQNREIPWFIQLVGLSIASLGLLYTVSSSEQLTSGVPPNTMLLPVPSWAIVAARFGWNVSAIAILSAALWGATRSLAWFSMPTCWVFVAVATAIFAVLQALALASGPLGDGSLGVLAAASIALLWFADLATAEREIHRLPLRALGLIAASALASWCVVSMQRRGAWAADTFDLAPRRAGRRARRSAPFSSPQAAQRWFEARRIGGFFLPILIGAVVVWASLLILYALPGDDWLRLDLRASDTHFFERFLVVFAVPFVTTVGVVSGALMTFLNFRLQLGPMRAFYFIRPFSSADLATARLTTLIRLFAIPILLACAIPVAFALIGTYRAYRDAMFDPGTHVLEIAPWALSSVAIYWLKCLAAVGTALATMWILLWIPLDGAAVVLYVGIGWFIDVSFVQGWMRQPTLLWAVSAIGFVLGTAVLHRFTHRRGLLNAGLLRNVIIGALAFAFLFAFFNGLQLWGDAKTHVVRADTVVPARHVLPPKNDAKTHVVEAQTPIFFQLHLLLDRLPGFVSVLAYCLLPFSTVPLTLHWARHR